MGMMGENVTTHAWAQTNSVATIRWLSNTKHHFDHSLVTKNTGVSGLSQLFRTQLESELESVNRSSSLKVSLHAFDSSVKGPERSYTVSAMETSIRDVFSNDPTSLLSKRFFPLVNVSTTDFEKHNPPSDIQDTVFVPSNKRR